MKPSEIYREAARRVELKDEESCCVVRQVADVLSVNDPILRNYAETMGPYDNPDHNRGFWLSKELFVEERQDWRVLALCFMACIAEDEERRATV